VDHRADARWWAAVGEVQVCELLNCSDARNGEFGSVLIPLGNWFDDSSTSRRDDAANAMRVASWTANFAIAQPLERVAAEYESEPTHPRFDCVLVSPRRARGLLRVNDFKALNAFVRVVELGSQVEI